MPLNVLRIDKEELASDLADVIKNIADKGAQPAHFFPSHTHVSLATLQRFDKK